MLMMMDMTTERFTVISFWSFNHRILASISTFLQQVRDNNNIYDYDTEHVQ